MATDSHVYSEADLARRYRHVDWTWYRPLLSHCVRYGMPGLVLDIGAGLGFLSECCQRWGIQCVGIDGSAYAVEQACARGLDIRHCLLTDDVRLPFEDDAFSVVVMNQVLNYVPLGTARRAFGESHRVLRREGAIIVTSVSRFFPGNKSEGGHVHFYTTSELRRDLEAAGFEIVADLNEPRRILGDSLLGRSVMKVLYRVFRWDLLSESQGFIARKAGPATGVTVHSAHSER